MLNLDFTPDERARLSEAQKLLVKTTKDFLALEKPDLGLHHFRCFLGRGCEVEPVVRILARANEDFWPIVANARTGERLGLARYLEPYSPAEVWHSLDRGVGCLLVGTEHFQGNFLKRLESAGLKYIFHWGG